MTKRPTVLQYIPGLQCLPPNHASRSFQVYLFLGLLVPDRFHNSRGTTVLKETEVDAIMPKTPVVHTVHALGLTSVP